MKGKKQKFYVTWVSRAVSEVYAIDAEHAKELVGKGRDRNFVSQVHEVETIETEL